MADQPGSRDLKTLGVERAIVPDLVGLPDIKWVLVPTLPVISALIRWDEKAGLHGMRYAGKDRRARSAKKKETGYDLKSFDPNSRAQPPSPGDCDQLLARLSPKGGKRGR